MTVESGDYNFQISAPPSSRSLPLLAVSDRQDLYSMSFIQTIIATAGYNTFTPKLDRVKVDIGILLPNIADSLDALVEVPRHPFLAIQVKCTYAHSIGRDGTIHYSVDIDTHRFLVDSRSTPRILVLVHVPPPDSNGSCPWIILGTETMALRYRVYWLSLMGQPAVVGQESVTVKVPTRNIFDVEAVHTLVERMAFKGDKGYAG